eukprot:CAMPEP_0174234492 /NCGR_PEP_ID=MMETSP0417-20130205/4228_1 /TAXON_ID=242541 /ORGANISM="Mayorella sp, Strain BSH-02190019" /LENGTH=428 /DNA_ID=CAMNT_0015312859 /DNA_START=165 /DNA_END=1447 /DNA_ORIENTATION=-
MSVVKLSPLFFMHVLNRNSNLTHVVRGPTRHTLLTDEVIVLPPQHMITIGPHQYALIENPVKRTEDGNLVRDDNGQVLLRHGDKEVYFHQPPFPLYPGQNLVGQVRELRVVPANNALLLCATRDFIDRYSVDEHGTPLVRKAGDEWLFQGPRTYLPQAEESVVETVQATVIRRNQALLLEARRDGVDYLGRPRLAGEQWLVKQPGAYMPAVWEKVIQVMTAFVMTEDIGAHMIALSEFVDQFGHRREPGDQWLITRKDAEEFIPDVQEKVSNFVNLTVLSDRQFCVIENPVVDGRAQIGTRVMVRGERRFFLRPGEKIEAARGVCQVPVLDQNHGLQMRALQAFNDESTTTKPVARRAGDRWYVWGPREYWPPLEAEIVGSVTFGQYFARRALVPFLLVTLLHLLMQLVCRLAGLTYPVGDWGAQIVL